MMLLLNDRQGMQGGGNYVDFSLFLYAPLKIIFLVLFTYTNIYTYICIQYRKMNNSYEYTYNEREASVFY